MMAIETELITSSMGGTLRLLVATSPEGTPDAEQDLMRVAGRIEAWARRLTRFSPTSDLSVLNADPDRPVTRLRPTMSAVLAHACDMAAVTEGTVDVAMLDARIGAEAGSWPHRSGCSSWALDGCGRQRTLVRHGRSRFDLDGVAKGWLADRALRLLGRYPSALVDADGDVAVRTSDSRAWSIAVGHPQDDRAELAQLRAPQGWSLSSFGVATSGTSVHRWSARSGPTHHLIDPLTGRSAVTDVVQATVVADSAALAECLAKSAVIQGSQLGLGLLDRAGAAAALLLLEDGQLLATTPTLEWLV